MLARLALLLLAVPLATAGAPPPGCMKSCANLASNCLAFARTARAESRDACSGDRSCKRAATRTFHGARTECRRARAECRPCCRLGGVNECAHRDGGDDPRRAAGGGRSGARPRRCCSGGDYMTCGVPYKLWSERVRGRSSRVASAAAGRAAHPRPQRQERRPAVLPERVHRARNGAEVVNANCLMCHGGMFDGQLPIGLGNATADFTAAPAAAIDRRAADG